MAVPRGARRLHRQRRLHLSQVGLQGVARDRSYVGQGRFSAMTRRLRDKGATNTTSAPTPFRGIIGTRATREFPKNPRVSRTDDGQVDARPRRSAGGGRARRAVFAPMKAFVRDRRQTSPSMAAQPHGGKQRRCRLLASPSMAAQPHGENNAVQLFAIHAACSAQPLDSPLSTI